ncbi:hypothetical protein [Novosphingobium sp. 9]|uniref:hypothetical protein n=1 Tax=Novosphingobium sp. 9 TaxID=2025349 RepID=UPI0021B69C1B|nr:hypothetical protein [Novosphingobium sp. 9]
MADAPHQCFTASATSYLRNMDHEDRREPCFAVHYQKPPEDAGNGMRSISLNFPLLVVSLYADAPKDVAERVARILNAHWDNPEFNELTEAPHA